MFKKQNKQLVIEKNSYDDVSIYTVTNIFLYSDVQNKPDTYAEDHKKILDTLETALRIIK